MKRLEKEYSDRRLKVLWIGFQDKETKIREFMEKHDVREGVCFDSGNVISKKYGIKYGAGLVIVNSEGIVVKRVPKGFSEKDLLDAMDAAFSQDGKRAGGREEWPKMR